MAEICLDCHNRMMKKPKKKRQVLLTRGCDLCEVCGMYRQVIIRYLTYREQLLVLVGHMQNEVDA